MGWTRRTWAGPWSARTASAAATLWATTAAAESAPVGADDDGAAAGTTAVATTATESPRPARDHHRAPLLSVRAEAGFGGGNLGLADRAAGALELWPSALLGIGAFAGAAEQSPFCVFCFGGNTDERTLFAGGMVAARSAPGPSYGRLSLGAGYVWGTRATSPPVSFFGPSGPTPNQEQSLGGAIITAAASWLWHPAFIELGPSLNLDVTTWGRVTVTMNFVLGLSAR